jgi:hypothetical protein
MKMAVEFRPVRCSIDPETGLFWVDDSLNYPRLICEARTADGLRRKIARLLGRKKKRRRRAPPLCTKGRPSYPVGGRPALWLSKVALVATPALGSR